MTEIKKIVSLHSGNLKISTNEEVEIIPDIIVMNEKEFERLFKMLEDGGSLGMPDQKLVLITNCSGKMDDNLQDSEIQRFKELYQEKLKFQQFKSGHDGTFSYTLNKSGIAQKYDFLLGSRPCLKSLGAFQIAVSCQSSKDILESIFTGKMQVRVPETIKIILTGKRMGRLVTSYDLGLTILKQLKDYPNGNYALEIYNSYKCYLHEESKLGLVRILINLGADFVFLINPEQTNYSDNNINLNYSNSIRKEFKSDYLGIIEINLEKITPMVVLPGFEITEVSNISGQRIKLDKIAIGGCLGGSLNTITQVANYLRRHEIKPDLQFCIYPSRHRTIAEMFPGDIVLDLTSKGIRVSPPACDFCYNPGKFALDRYSKGLFTLNPEFNLKNGYFASHFTSAASAITGMITDPVELSPRYGR